MALIVSDRVKETTSTTGTGTYTLAGALPSYASFADIGNGNTTYYACTDGTDWEVGIGTYTASGTTLARTTILQSSNSDAAVNWGSGIKTIFCTLPAEKYIFKDADGDVSIADDLYVSNKIIHIGDTDTYMNFPADETWQVVTQNSSAIKATELQITLGRNVISTYNATFTGNVNAAQFRAQADTGYYLDPDGDSVLSNIQLYNNDAGASAGPTFELYRDSASPASSDQLGEIIFSGKDSSGNKNNNIRIYQDYVQILSSQRIPSLIIGATAEISGLQQSELNVFEANRGSVSLMGDVLVVGGASATIKENFTAEKNLNVDGLLKTDTILSATDPGTIGIGLTATGGSTLNDLTLTGNLTVTGTVDGRDVSVDGAKLDLIEAGATADQTKADIDALGINADQVDGLEASQFLRSDANDTGTKLTLETLNLTSDNTSSKHLTLTNDTGPNLTVQVYGSGSSTLTIENASTSTDLLSLTDAGNLTVAGTVEGRNLVNDGAKLDLIEAGATADQTKADIDALGIDADQLDGQEGTYYLDYNNFTNTPTIPTVPTNVSAFTNDAGYITSADGGNADQLDGQEGTYYLNYNNFTNTPTIPTNNNQLTNGAGYITNVLTSTDAGATAGPTLELYRNSASPATSDLMGEIRFEGEDYDGTKVLNGRMYSTYGSITSGSRRPEVFITAGYRVGSVETSVELLKGSAGGVSLFNDKLVIDSNGPSTPNNLQVDGTLQVDSFIKTDLILGSTDVTKGIGLTSTGSSSLHNLSLSGKLTSTISAGSTALDLATNDGYAEMRVIRNATADTTNDDGMYIGYANSSSGVTRIYGGGATSGGIVVSGSGVNDVTIAGSTAWHAGNDGSGSGLDADLLDGLSPATTATGNTIVQREANGHIYGNYILGTYFNASSGNSENPTIGQIWTQSTADNYLRKSTPAHFISQLGLWTSGNDGSGSGLDADLLDGLHESTFMRKSANSTLNMNNNDINYVNQLHFNDGVRFVDEGNDQYLRFRYNDTSSGGIKVYNGNDSFQGYFYASGDGRIGILPPDGSWGIEISNTKSNIYHRLDTPIVYDLDDTGYYLNPAGTSLLNVGYTRAWGVNRAGSQTTGDGLALYGAYTGGEPTYGIMFSGRGTFGGHGVMGATDWATYFTMNNDTSRGWIFRRVGSGNSASITAGGIAQFDSSVRSPIFYDSADTNWYVDPASSSSARLRQFVQIGDSSSYGTNSGSWGARLNVTDDVHARIDVAQDANSMRSYWYAHTGQTAIKFGTETSHDVEIHRGSAAELGVYSGYAQAINQMRAPIYYDSNNTSYLLDLTAGGKLLGNFEFASNNTSTSYSVASIELRESNYTANATATPPFLGFHWGGVVASSIALESSGRIAIRNNPGTGYENFIAATITSTGTVDAPQFRDSNNTGYYADPASTSRLNAIDFGTSGYYIHAGNWGMRNTTPDGYIEFGPANTSHAHIYTDRPNFYFNKELIVNGNTVWNAGNDGSGSGLDADLLDGSQGTYYDHRRYTDSSTYLGGYYVSGGSEKPNNTIFGAGKLKIAMLSGSNLGFGGSWNDVLWMSTYTGGDVKPSWAIVGDKYSDNVYVSRQNYDSASWGTGHKLWHTGNDGSGSGLDADLLDGYHASTTRNAANTIPIRDGNGYLQLGWINTTSGSTTATIDRIYASYDGYIRYITPATLISQLGLWTSGNDGFGSGLDADLLDGLQASQLLRSDVSDTMSGDLTLTGTVYLSEKIAHYGDTDTWISFSSDDTISLVVGNSTAIKCLNYIEVRKNIISTGNATFASTVDATQFRDKDNTGYYVDPASSSAMSYVSVDNSIQLNNSYLYYTDTDRNAGSSTYYPNAWARGIRFSFATASTTSTGGNYSGVLHFHPWDGTSASTGDASYQLAFGSTAVNNTGEPQLVIRNGINTSWNSWRYIPMYGLNQYTASFYATIYYDSFNTAYYVNPNSTSSLGQIDLKNANKLVNYVNGTGNAIYQSIAGSGASTLYWKHGTSGANLMYLDSSGNLTATGNVTAYSDIKLKDDIQVIDNAIDKVKQIRGVTFTRNDTHDDKRQTGVIAQEVEQVLPEVVTESDYDGVKSVAYGNMVGLLIEAIKEQQKQIEDQQVLIEALQEQINGLTK